MILALDAAFPPHSLTARLVAYLRAQPQPVYLVGGFVRDLLLGRLTRDVDVSVAGDALPLARRIADDLGGAFVALDAARDTGRAVFTDVDGSVVYVDCAAWRADTLTDDLRLRDFTVNALAVDLARPQAEIIDVTGGLQDLAQRWVRVTSPQALVDDPLRGLRGVRLLAELAPWQFRLEEGAARALREHAALLAQPAAERVRDELVRILDVDRPDLWLRLMDELGQLPVVLPEMAALHGVGQSAPHRWDVFEHTLGVVRHVAWQRRWLNGAVAAASWDEEALAAALAPLQSTVAAHFAQRDGSLRSRGQMWPWAALSHDWGKPATRSEERPVGRPPERVRFWGHERVSVALATAALRRLRFNEAEVRRVGVIVAEHMRPLQWATAERLPTQRAVYRFFRAAGSAGVDVALLSLADVWATYGPQLTAEVWSQQLAVVRRLLEDFFWRHDDRVAPAPLLNGDDLMQALDLAPGPVVGRLLAEMAEAQAAGEVATRDEALALAARLLEEFDSRPS